MRSRILLSIIFLLTSSLVAFAQVSKRDTVIQWRHFDYSMDDNYSLDSYSESEIVTTSYDGIVLENELVKICLIPEFGARIISFFYKPTGKEQLYQNPVGVPYQIESGIFYHNWLMVYGGIFPTFPEPEHGKYWNVPWNENILEDSEEKITISMWVKDELDNPNRPGNYNYGVTGVTCYYDVSLEAGKPYFSVDVRLENDENANELEYWTCLTFAPGSEIENTFTPSESEMIVPIDNYQVGWNPNNWMNSLDKAAPGGNSSVRVYDKLAHLSNWEDQGIAYAHPSLDRNFYGVINHTNEQGLFRLSDDQSKTPGLKFWTWGDSQGLAADPNDFNQEERPYIELWSGISNEFFQSASMEANATISFTETYWPTVDIPVVTFMDEEVAFGSMQNENTIDLFAYLPVEADNALELEFSVLDQNDIEVYQTSVNVSPNLLTSTKLSIDLESIDVPSGARLEANITSDGTVLWTDNYEYVISNINEVIIDAAKPQLSVQNNQLRINFVNENAREIVIYDMMGKRLNQLSTSQRMNTLNYPGAGIYIVHVIENNRRWTKKIAIRD